MKTLPLYAALVLMFTSCASTQTSSFKLIKETHLKMKTPPTIGKTSTGQDLFLGGFSGLLLKEQTSDGFRLATITDRGPNGYVVGIERPFLLPEYSPQIVELKVDLKTNTFEVLETIKLKKKNGQPLSGLPNVRTEENPVNIFGHMISLDPDGMDTESLVSDDEGGFWIGEEYSPSLAHFDSSGKLLRRLLPYNELPKVYAERKTNRGFEGIAKRKNKLYGFLQSPLKIDQNGLRIVEVDLDSMKTDNEYLYELDNDKDRIGDVISLSENKFLVVEQNGKTGEAARKAIYKISLKGADSAVKKELLINLTTTAFKNLEKVEGITLLDKHRIALVNDNDFQIAGPTDSKTGMTPLNKQENEMLILEFAEDLTN